MCCVTPKYSRSKDAAPSFETHRKRPLNTTGNHLETTGIRAYEQELRRLTADVLRIFGAYPIDGADVQRSRLPLLNKHLSSLG